MSEKKESCAICSKSVSDHKKCKSCGRVYCPKCQSPSTKQNFCRECVSMEGMVSKEA